MRKEVTEQVSLKGEETLRKVREFEARKRWKEKIRN